MKTFTEAKEILKNRTSRKLANNTYMRLEDAETISIRLHATDIITYKADGRVILNSGGWRTPTTKQRINEFSPVRISQEQGIWYAAVNGTRAFDLVFDDGMAVNTITGEITGTGSAKQQTAVRRQVKKFVEGYMAALFAGEIPKPSAGDCMYCGLHGVEDGKPLGELAKDKSHIELHLEEKYYVPSLLPNALKAMHNAPAAFWGLAAFWHDDLEEREKSKQWANTKRDTWKRALRRYIFRQLGIG